MSLIVSSRSSVSAISMIVFVLVLVPREAAVQVAAMKANHRRLLSLEALYPGDEFAFIHCSACSWPLLPGALLPFV